MRYNGENFEKVIEQHMEWVSTHGICGSCADFEGANLAGQNFAYRDLADALMAHTNLQGANLCATNLTRTDLHGADMRGSNMYLARLRGANLLGAKIDGANLCAADLRSAKNVPHIPMACPEEGAFIGYKVAINEKATTDPSSGNIIVQNTMCIVTLAIPDRALRSSAAGRKCRCDEAKVLKITDVSGQRIFNDAHSTFDSGFIYRTGGTVSVEEFSANRWDECAPGIHFFVNRCEAVEHSRTLGIILELSAEENGGKA